MGMWSCRRGPMYNIYSTLPWKKKNNLLLVFQTRLCIKVVLCSAPQITEEVSKLRPSGLCWEIKRLQGNGKTSRTPWPMLLWTRPMEGLSSPVKPISYFIYIYIWNICHVICIFYQVHYMEGNIFTAGSLFSYHVQYNETEQSQEKGGGEVEIIWTLFQSFFFF